MELFSSNIYCPLCGLHCSVIISVANLKQTPSSFSLCLTLSAVQAVLSLASVLSFLPLLSNPGFFFSVPCVSIHFQFSPLQLPLLLFTSLLSSLFSFLLSLHQKHASLNFSVSSLSRVPPLTLLSISAVRVENLSTNQNEHSFI